MGAILSVIALGEQLHWTAYAGCTLILMGAMTVNNILKPIPWLQASVATVLWSVNQR
jgi:hypothetical protein